MSKLKRHLLEQMTEKNVIDSLLENLIEIHLKKSNINYNKNYDKQLIQDAEIVIGNLKEKDRETITRYIDSLMDRMAKEELCLYTAGIKDGIRLLNWITMTGKGLVD